VDHRHRFLSGDHLRRTGPRGTAAPQQLLDDVTTAVVP
jgi:hypothetical protein